MPTEPITMAELEAALAAGRADQIAAQMAALRDQSDIFGLYVVAVARALEAAKRPHKHNAARSRHAIAECLGVLMASGTTPPARHRDALTTLEHLRLLAANHPAAVWPGSAM